MPKPAIDLDAIKAIADQYGYSIDVESLKPRAELQAETAKASRLNLSAGTLLLESLHTKHKLMQFVCKSCSRTFTSNFCRDKYCSDSCMKRDFEKHYGIAWDRLVLPGNPWPQEEPFRVSPDKVEALYEWAREFVTAYENGTLNLQPEEIQDESESLLSLEDGTQDGDQPFPSPTGIALPQSTPEVLDDGSLTSPPEEHFSLADVDLTFDISF